MKKKLILLSSLLILTCTMLTGCGNKEKEITNSINKYFDSIKEETIDLSGYDIYERLNIKDRNYNLSDIDENNFENKLISNLEYEIKDIEVNNSTAEAKVKLTVKDFGAILSSDEFMTKLVIFADNELSTDPSLYQKTLDLKIIEYIDSLIKEDKSNFTSVEVKFDVMYSETDKKWNVDVNEKLINAILGNVSFYDYSIELNDLFVENETEIEIDYNVENILDLPESNKTTRSTLKSPIQLNSEAYFDNTDYFYKEERYGLKVTVVDVMTDSEAYEFLRKDNDVTKISVNDEYVIAKVKIELDNNKTENKYVNFSITDFSLINENGKIYPNEIVFGIDEFKPIEEGQETEGYVVFVVPNNAKKFLLFKDYMNNTLCFDLN